MFFEIECERSILYSDFSTTPIAPSLPETAIGGFFLFMHCIRLLKETIMNQNNHSRSRWNRFIVGAATLLMLGIAMAACNLPRPQSQGGTTPPAGGTAPVVASVQSNLSSSSSGKGNMNCQKDGPWYLNVDHNYSITVGSTNANVKIGGDVPLFVDSAGNVTAGATQADGSLNQISKDCHIYATWKYHPQIKGTCRSGVMNLNIAENLGDNGAIQATMECEDKKMQNSIPVPGTMNHDLTFVLTKENKGSALIKIDWGLLGSPGYKSWYVSNSPSLPLVPLVNPTP
jgi:hypothetical protein